ncbi:MAG: 16S rRNA (adenine(1518)-N(6)/adenine(1519)-N(6))-dimethyltransferase RsmA [Oscillospiraceae bacterium]|jgi:16S rRNA (adenine1518-N6/adenine1519-N6)-dimethyltransferase|nr:16S rRNA (adenine(1518)-N(6)/adenine(1519)-N(6))-dimethyltransferase RsmA [Oscillospiraceae bacterium]MCI1990069.1 16S rRNA (adenine(1518)-N(6)/adenine(1519)-N(6))-dimethyltransferase RsmA [Oscillospiraceae bacterium]MCI2034731.1 16S rRNA (adenine(1518)-N(6)/adenine(1519)-N(6))-dimethyltransferase RsmA [Oscillospiraceae bacterium]
MDLSDLGTVRAVLARHGFRFSHSLGQNFIVDPAVCPRMAELCGAGKESGVLEVGPGVGVLTRELAARAGQVVSVELDRSLEPVLKETLAGCRNFKIVWGDVLKLDLQKLIREEFAGKDVYVCANLPYYITSPVVMRFLEEKLPVRALTVMVQKEAAGRLCAEPGTRACGAVSAAVRYYSEPRVLFSVPRACFYPQPNVDSAVIRLDVLEHPPVSVPDGKAFFALVKAAFGQRRKTAANSISAGLALPKSRVAEALRAAGAPPGIRSERLTMGQLAELTNLLCQKGEIK